MPLGDTIAAIASPPTRSARGVIRLSGPATREALAAVSDSQARPWDRGAFAARMRLDQLQLPLLVLAYRAPRSYTGEDAAELLLPGNPALLERVMAALLALPGVRQATPGEFTARAYLNERLTLAQAEGVAGVIAAGNAEQLEAARGLLEGSTGAQYNAWAEELATLLALVEAGIDFTDQEDVVAIAPAELVRRLAALAAAIRQFTGAEAGAAVRAGIPRVVLAGRPNAGKSTLFNALLGRERAVVSEVAGTTRDVLEEPLDLCQELPGAGPVLLIDLAGLDDPATGKIDPQVQQGAGEAIRSADVIVHCDPTGRFEPLGSAAPTIRVRTKADLPGTDPAGDIAVCALDHWNLPTLRRAIADAALGSREAATLALLPRHRRALAETLRATDEARALAADDQSIRAPELVAGGLRAALDSLGDLTGHISPDEIVGRIFARFCIGK
jgi:tRNA modification GTPase